ncbi:MAG TPA: uridine phosphorylase, partial [Chloroflexi bacterium]|nr:uridine phosphorylase [Chloroflexota bacterium]
MTEFERRADRPVAASGKQYHIDLGSGDLGETVLLPGDPFRVPTLAEAWDSREEVGHHREYRSMRGT